MQRPPHEYDDNCEDCQPAMVDVNTGKPLADDNPLLIAARKAWKEKTTLTERRATSRVWMGQSTNPIDIEIMEKVGLILQEAMKEADNG